MESKNVAIILARMGSTRFPGKVLKGLSGRPMLARLISRIKPSKHLDKIIVATSLKSEDDPIEECCNREGVFCFRGDSEDVLKRLHDAAIDEEATEVTIILSDNPLVHHSLVDAVVAEYYRNGKHYSTNYSNTVLLNGDPLDWRKFPEGIGVQICSRADVEQAHRHASERYHRVHAMTYIFTQRASFGGTFLFAEDEWSELNEPDLFLAVNTPQQFAAIEAIFEIGLQQSDLFDLYDAIKIAKTNNARA